MMFTEALTRRTDGYWELLATAAGSPEAVSKTRNGLTCATLERGAFGDAIAPSIIRMRVEALAAWNRTALVELTSQWNKPSEIHDDPAWTAAWTASMRHLQAVKAFDSAYFDVPELASEMAIVFSTRKPTVSWGDLADRWRTVHPAFDHIREMAQGFLVEASISKEDILTAPIAMLRLLRGRARLLEHGAVEAIETRAYSALDHLDFEAAIVFDALCEPELRNETLPSLGRAKLTASLEAIHDPRQILELAYVLLGKWRLP